MTKIPPAQGIDRVERQSFGKAEEDVPKATGMKLAVVQSNYIPWKGYFDLVNSVDKFILFDDMQYTRRDWRNRNKIKTPLGPVWLTIPVDVKGKYQQTIRETRISDLDWKTKHWKTIQHNYNKAKYFREYRDFFEELFLGSEEKFLSQVNYRFLRAICDLLGIRTELSWSMEYRLSGERSERLVNLCKQVGATEYLSGPTAKGYLKEELFAQEGMLVTYMDYSGYPEYEQLHPPFEHAVSIVDLMFNVGADFTHYMKSF